EQLAGFFGQGVKRCGFAFHHVFVEGRRATNSLAGVVDYEVQTIARAQHLGAERLDTRRVTQIEPVDGEPVAPLRKVRFLRVARRRVAWKARCDYEMCTGAQKPDAGLISDLDSSAREQRNTAAQIGGLRTLREIELSARLA